MTRVARTGLRMSTMKSERRLQKARDKMGLKPRSNGQKPLMWMLYLIFHFRQLRRRISSLWLCRIASERKEQRVLRLSLRHGGNHQATHQQQQQQQQHRNPRRRSKKSPHQVPKLLHHQQPQLPDPVGRLPKQWPRRRQPTHFCDLTDGPARHALWTMPCPTWPVRPADKANPLHLDFGRATSVRR